MSNLNLLDDPAIKPYTDVTLYSLDVTTGTSTNTFQMRNNPVLGAVLTSDALGNATWAGGGGAPTPYLTASVTGTIGGAGQPWVLNPLTIELVRIGQLVVCNVPTLFAIGNNVNAYALAPGIVPVAFRPPTTTQGTTITALDNGTWIPATGFVDPAGDLSYQRSDTLGFSANTAAYNNGWLNHSLTWQVL